MRKLDSICNKSGYRSYKSAKKQVIRHKVRRKMELRQYHCPKCGLYHLTHIQDFNKHVMSMKDLKTA